MTWVEMNKKYPEYREDMTEEREREFVEDCFKCYEQEGFASKFWSQCDDLEQYSGMPFEVVGRVPEYDEQRMDGAVLECLPMWRIRFEDGTEVAAYPDEIIEREMIDNGCKKSFFENKD